MLPVRLFKEWAFKANMGRGKTFEARMKEIGWFPGCTEVGEIEAQFRRHGRTNGLDLIPTLMLRQATIHFAPTNRLDPVPVHSLSVYLSISISVKDWATR